jgi:Zn finger protein HypA/HybF involved in hydrogenase expression
VTHRRVEAVDDDDPDLDVCERCRHEFAAHAFSIALCPDCVAAEEAERYGEEIGDFGEDDDHAP